MIEFLVQNRWGILVFTLLFCASRIWLDMAGIGPDQDVVLDHWQHADLKLLATHYWKTLWFQHSQPPLWNGIIGAALNLLGNNSEFVTRGLHFLFILFSYIGSLLILAVFTRFGLNIPTAFAAAFIFSVSPAVLLYENYIFYPHLTWFLVVIFLFGLSKVKSDNDLWPIGVCFVSLVALAWTWALFHPAFVMLIGAGVLWVGHRLFQRNLVFLLLLTTLLSLLPIVKNTVVFGIPSASSWFGMNVAQTAVPFGSEKSIYCDFYLVHQSIWRESEPPSPVLYPSLTDTLKSSGHANLNHIGIAKRASECLKIAIDSISFEPGGWLAHRADALIVSHQIPAFEYLFQPVGWDKIFPERLQSTDVSKTLLPSFFATLILWGAYKSISGAQRRLFAVILFFILYFTLVSHLANGQEQQRMRYTISPLYWYLLISMLFTGSNWVKDRFSRTRTASGI